MAAYLSTELGGAANLTAPASPAYRPVATVYQARLKSIRASFTYNTQTTSDTLVIGNLPAGATFAGGELITDTSSGSATLAIGYAGSTAAFKAAAAFTTTETVTPFGKTAAMAAAPLAAETQVFITIAAASAPASGNLLVYLFYTMPN
jgi:hypothetical protein